MSSNVDFSDRSSRAHHNGLACEEQIIQLLPAFHLVDGGEVDGELFGDPAEIKGCQNNNFRCDRKNPRAGRFYLRDYQHNYLVKNNGRYILAVMEEERIVRTRIVLASRLSPEFDGCKTLTWGAVFRAMGVCS